MNWNELKWWISEQMKEKGTHKDLLPVQFWLRLSTFTMLTVFTRYLCGWAALKKIKKGGYTLQPSMPCSYLLHTDTNSEPHTIISATSSPCYECHHQQSKVECYFLHCAGMNICVAVWVTGQIQVKMSMI